MSSSDEGFDKKTNSVMINKEGEHMERGVFDAEIKGDIKMLVNIYIDAEKSNAEGFRSINPSLLLDNSHILTKGRLYENVIEELLQEEGEGRVDIAIIERVDAFLTGFISSERKARSKLKLNYIIAGASSNRMESAIGMLSETDQIDDDLLMFIDALIRKKKVSSGKMEASFPGYDSLEDSGLHNQGGTLPPRPSMTSAALAASGERSDKGVQDYTIDDDDDSGLVGLGEGNDAIAVLQMVRRRLVAEIRTADKPEVRLLASLLAEPDISRHNEMIRLSLVRVEQMENFETFLENGINHLSVQDAEVAGDDPGSEPFAVIKDDTQKRGGDHHIAPDTVEKMKGVLITLREVMQLFENRDVFEVNADDTHLRGGAAEVDHDR